MMFHPDLVRLTFICFVLVCVICFFPGSIHSNQVTDNRDVSDIDSIVKALYESITFKEGKAPDMDRMQLLFLMDSTFIRVSELRVDKMNREGFVSSFKKMIEEGLLKSFHESEISRKTLRYGRIAQVFSSYRKEMKNKDGLKLKCRGINSMQLFYDGKRWWISSILWMDETENNIIPKKFLH